MDKKNLAMDAGYFVGLFHEAILLIKLGWLSVVVRPRPQKWQRGPFIGLDQVHVARSILFALLWIVILTPTQMYSLNHYIMQLCIQNLNPKLHQSYTS